MQTKKDFLRYVIGFVRVARDMLGHGIHARAALFHNFAESGGIAPAGLQ